MSSPKDSTSHLAPPSPATPTHHHRHGARHSRTQPDSFPSTTCRSEWGTNPPSPPKRSKSERSTMSSRDTLSVLGNSGRSQGRENRQVSRPSVTDGLASSRSKRTVSFSKAGEEGQSLQQSNYRWNEGEELFSSGRNFYSSGFDPKLTSTLTASRGLEGGGGGGGGGGSLVSAWRGSRGEIGAGGHLSDDSLESDEDFSFSDEVRTLAGGCGILVSLREGGSQRSWGEGSGR